MNPDESYKLMMKLFTIYYRWK